MLLFILYSYLTISPAFTNNCAVDPNCVIEKYKYNTDFVLKGVADSAIGAGLITAVSVNYSFYSYNGYWNLKQVEGAGCLIAGIIIQQLLTNKNDYEKTD